MFEIPQLRVSSHLCVHYTITKEIYYINKQKNTTVSFVNFISDTCKTILTAYPTNKSMHFNKIPNVMVHIHKEHVN